MKGTYITLNHIEHRPLHSTDLVNTKEKVIKKKKGTNKRLFSPSVDTIPLTLHAVQKRHEQDLLKYLTRLTP